MFDIGSILLILALAVAVGLVVSLPFFDRLKGKQKLVARPAAAENTQKRSTLLAERDRLLASLQDLEFDHSMGKLDAEAYAAQRSLLLQSGATTLRELDEMDGGSAVVEAETPETAAEVHDELEALIARHKGKQKGGRVCRKCGATVRAGDRFCSKCGTEA